MSTETLRPVRIGMLLNSTEAAGAFSLEKQYAMEEGVFEEIADVLRKHGAIVGKLQVQSNIHQLLNDSLGEYDLIFNLAEGIYQMLAPMVMEQIKLENKDASFAFTGSSSQGQTLALDKSISRKVLLGKVSQPDWWYLNDETSPVPSDINFPVLIKPTNEGHSIGIKQENVIYSMEELKRVLGELFDRIGGGMLIETFLDGEEYSMGIIGNVVFPAAVWDLDQLPGAPLVRGEDLKQNDLTIPHAKIVKNPEKALDLAKQVVNAHHGLGLSDYSRSDFRAKKDGETCYFLEVNSMCGIRNLQSVLPWTAAQAGVEYETLIGSIVAQALQRIPNESREALNTQSFDLAFERLQERGRSKGETFQIQGKEFFMLNPE